jgi:hypothetical protein
MWPGHPHIGDESGPLRQHVLIGSGHVRMRPNYHCSPSVQIPTQCDFFTGSLGVHVHEHHRHVWRQRCQQLIGFLKGIINRRQEHASLQIDNTVLNSVFRYANVNAATGTAVREIGGPQQPRLMRQVVENLFFIPAMVATGQYRNVRL